MNLDRRIKKHIHGKPQQVRITCPPGLESVAQTELRLLLSTRATAPDFLVDIHCGEGELAVKNIPYADVQYLVPRLRSASEIYIAMAKARCLTRSDLMETLRQIVWPMYLGNRVRLRVRSFKSRLYHETMIKEIVLESLQLASVSVVDDDDAPLLEVVMRRDEITIEVGLAGRPLHHRDFKVSRVSSAPLKSNVAYSCIASFYAWAAKSNDCNIIIPFAGSGTLGFESVLYLCDTYPGIWRNTYALCELPFFKPQSWQHFTPEPPQTFPDIEIKFVENDATQVLALRANCENFFRPFGSKISWTVEETDIFATHAGNLSVAFMNPPYGERLPLAKNFFDSLRRWIEAETQSGFALTPESNSLGVKADRFRTHCIEFQTGGRFTHMNLWGH